MATIPVRCTRVRCDGVVQVDKRRYDNDDPLILLCPKGHQFDHKKKVCPKCSATARPARFESAKVWFGPIPPGEHPVLRPARCTNSRCDWQGPK